jgi:two-component sensor histidine kinase/CheY-like chemotaxis protein
MSWKEALPVPKVLIAEDDLMMAEVLESALVASGYEVCGIARTVEGAIELGEHHRPELAVLNLRLADGGLGTDVANSIRRRGRVGILYATGHIDTTGLTGSDGEACIAKPYRTQDIVRGLEIVQQIVLTGGTSGPLPKGLFVLGVSSKGISSLSEVADPSISDLAASSIAGFPDLVRRLRLQRTELLRFSNYALDERDLDTVMSEATRICAACLGASYAAIGRYRPDDHAFVVQTAFGLPADFVGRVLPNVGLLTPFGRAFIAEEPVVSDDLINDASFSLPSYYAEYGVVSVLVVPIKSEKESRKHGVLVVGSTIRRSFDAADASFLTLFANVVARAIDAKDRNLSLETVTDQLHEMIIDRDRYIAAHELILAGKDRLLETNSVLTKELEHRVRNNLQLIYSMLNQQLNGTTDAAAIDGIGKIANRVMVLVEMYEKLLGRNLGRTIDFGGYLSSLCASFLILYTASHPKVELACRPVPVRLGLDTVTTLGLVISELVANSYKHAFAGGTGTISVSLSVDPSGGNATLIFGDDGVGFVDALESKGHGVGLVCRLMEQIDGSATLRSDHGRRWTLTFPVPTGPSDDASIPSIH